MPFRLTTCSILLMIPLIYSNHAFAETNLPLDLIELLGEMDDDNMLEMALSELTQKTNKPQINHDNKQDIKQNSVVSALAGGDKK